MIDDVIAIKRCGRCLYSFEEFCRIVGNKSVFSYDDLWRRYHEDFNVTVIKMLYCGYFGAGKNVNLDWLDRNDLWSTEGVYPANLRLTPKQCATVWQAGGIDVYNAVGR